MTSGVIKCQERAWNRPEKGKNVGEKQLRMRQRRNKRMGRNKGKGRCCAQPKLCRAEGVEAPCKL